MEGIQDYLSLENYHLEMNILKNEHDLHRDGVKYTMLEGNFPAIHLHM
jgi:hypothetical protein